MSRKHQRRGASAVEFAIVLPVLVLLTFGLIEFGRLVMVQQVLTNASREGARVGVLDNATTAEVNTAVSNYLTTSKITGATVSVSPNPPSTAGYGQPVTVTVNVPFTKVSWLPAPWFNKTTTMSAATSMRRETVE